jgi:hypothetical protein
VARKASTVSRWAVGVVPMGNGGVVRVTMGWICVALDSGRAKENPPGDPVRAPGGLESGPALFLAFNQRPFSALARHKGFLHHG